ncbi:MAG: hypothetical protein A2Z16_05955 [Chloroflexi bacterium RBG_16_54_18]|nr:MAG: hypothetical protein A2Z16_05955 [Chloroflexi bacterium RBG_16_54_18]
MLVACLLAGCTSPSARKEGLVTPLPTGFMPTVVALTLQAGNLVGTLPVKNTPLAASPGNGSAIPLTPLESAVEPGPSASAQQPAVTLTATLQPSMPAVITTPTASLTPTFLPEIPSAYIQIFQLGELSRVSSPIKVTARLFSKVGKVLRLELHGEDGRLLGRELSNLPAIPWSTALVSTEIDFEISLAAEYGRLVISVEDTYGRLIDVNSVNLILLQFGDSELNPATALWQVIQIDEPRPQTLIQGGSVFVSGLAHPNTDNPLFIELVGQDGQNLGHRLAAVDIRIPGGYGAFAADVPYLVTEVTPALLVVYESGGTLSEIAHLASVELLLSP